MTSTALTALPCLSGFSLIVPGPRELEFVYADLLRDEDCPLSEGTVYVLAEEARISDPTALAGRLLKAGAGLVILEGAGGASGLQKAVLQRDAPAVWAGRAKKPAAVLALQIQRELMCQLKQELDGITTVSHRFSFLSLELSEIQTIIDYFKEVIGNPIAVYDEYFRPIAATDDYVTDYRESPGPADHIFLYNIHFLKQWVTFCSEDAPRRECIRMLFPILLENKRTRAFLAVFEMNMPIEKIGMTIFEISATAVILAIKRRVALQSIEEKYVGDFIYDLIYRKDSPKEELVRRAQILGIREQAGYLVVAADVNVLDGGIELAQGTYVDVHDRILSAIDTWVNDQERNALITRFGKSVVVIYQLRRRDIGTLERVKRLIRELKNMLAPQFPGIAFYIGVGREVEGLQGIAKSYREAVSAISFGAAVHRPEESFLVSYEDSSLLKIFSRMSDRDMVGEIIPESLINLRQYDRENNANLYETLCVYLDCNCNAKRSSERLFIHYKTMLYRLEKLESEFGIDVENRRSRVQIELGVEMLGMLDYH